MTVLLEQPGEVDVGWLGAWYRGFGGFHYAVVLSEPPPQAAPPTVDHRMPPAWDASRIDTTEIVDALLASAEDPGRTPSHSGGPWGIRRDANRIVLYIEIEHG